MTPINIHEAKTHLSRLLDRVSKGERIVISKAGKPIADLVPHRSTPVAIGGLAGRIEYDDAAFEVDEEIQAMFYGADEEGWTS